LYASVCVDHSSTFETVNKIIIGSGCCCIIIEVSTSRNASCSCDDSQKVVERESVLVGSTSRLATCLAAEEKLIFFVFLLLLSEMLQMKGGCDESET
jgi:hypothetical protein